MSLSTTGIIGIIVLIVLLYSKMPVGFAMGFLGLIGFSYVVNFSAGLNLLARDVWDVFSSYNLTVIPLFVFMGQIAFHAGISRRLYDSAYVLLGHRRGGLAMTTVGACAAFSAICGSTNATAATMATDFFNNRNSLAHKKGLKGGGGLNILYADGSLQFRNESDAFDPILWQKSINVPEGEFFFRSILDRLQR